MTTLVTAFFDLGRREKSTRRPASDYFKHGEFVLGIEQNLVIFIDAEFAAAAWEKRKEAGLLHKTIVIPIGLEDLPAYSLMPWIERAMQEKPVKNGNPVKDTPLYTLLGWSKFYFLKRAMQLNIFKSTHYGWIDFGITHVADHQHVVEDGIYIQPLPGIRMMIMRPIPYLNIDNMSLDIRDQYFKARNGYMACGYFTAPLEDMQLLCDEFWILAEKVLDSGFGYAPLEDQLMPLLYNQSWGARFNPYYGDFKSILNNYRIPRGDFERIAMIMHEYREKNSYDKNIVLGELVWKSWLLGLIGKNYEALSRILDEYYIAAWYTDKELAYRVARNYLDLTKECSEFKAIYDMHKNHINTNFRFLPDHSRLGIQ